MQINRRVEHTEQLGILTLGMVAANDPCIRRFVQPDTNYYNGL